MGQKLCCLRPSAAEEQPRAIDALTKTRNLRESNKVMTLEECLKNSPAPAMSHRPPHPKKRVYPSTSPSPDSGNAQFSTPRLSFSSTPSSSVLLSGKNVAAVQPCRSYGRRREKSNKKVTFREEDDIILFYSPKQAFDDTMIG